MYGYGLLVCIGKPQRRWPTWLQHRIAPHSSRLSARNAWQCSAASDGEHDHNIVTRRRDPHASRLRRSAIMAIAYVEKGAGLHVAINAAGHWLEQRDGVW